jgi:two-component system, cell cycle sensor histidine kinase and response regulator CckA
MTAPSATPKDLETIKRDIAAIGSVAGPVAHDFNNILAAISGSATLLEIGSPNDAPRHLHNIQQASQRGARILRQLQALSARNDGEIAALDFKAVVDDACRRIRDSLGSSYTVTCAVQDDLPNVPADESQLRLLVSNLCDNARDAMPAGGSIIVSAAARDVTESKASQLGAAARAGRFVVLKVEDAGRGIPPEVLPRVFEPFFTTKSKTKDTGTGLGLAIALRIMLRHGGFITAESPAGGGAVVSCYFPAG